MALIDYTPEQIAAHDSWLVGLTPAEHAELVAKHRPTNPYFIAQRIYMSSFSTARTSATAAIAASF